MSSQWDEVVRIAIMVLRSILMIIAVLLVAHRQAVQQQ